MLLLSLAPQTVSMNVIECVREERLILRPPFLLLLLGCPIVLRGNFHLLFDLLLLVSLALRCGDTLGVKSRRRELQRLGEAVGLLACGERRERHIAVNELGVQTMVIVALGVRERVAILVERVCLREPHLLLLLRSFLVAIFLSLAVEQRLIQRPARLRLSQIR